MKCPALLLHYTSTAAHSANFNEKVHKPQSKTYHRIGAKMQLMHISYEFEYFYQCITTFWCLRDSQGAILMH